MPHPQHWSGTVTMISLHGLATALTGLALIGLPVHSATASETRGYVVSWFTVAMYSEDGDCPDGLNPTLNQMYSKILRESGKSPAEIETLLQHVSDLGPT